MLKLLIVSVTVLAAAGRSSAGCYSGACHPVKVSSRCDSVIELLNDVEAEGPVGDNECRTIDLRLDTSEAELARILEGACGIAGQGCSPKDTTLRVLLSRKSPAVPGYHPSQSSLARAFDLAFQNYVSLYSEVNSNVRRSHGEVNVNDADVMSMGMVYAMIGDYFSAKIADLAIRGGVQPCRCEDEIQNFERGLSETAHDFKARFGEQFGMMLYAIQESLKSGCAEVKSAWDFANEFYELLSGDVYARADVNRAAEAVNVRNLVLVMKANVLDSIREGAVRMIKASANVSSESVLGMLEALVEEIEYRLEAASMLTFVDTIDSEHRRICMLLDTIDYEARKSFADERASRQFAFGQSCGNDWITRVWTAPCSAYESAIVKPMERLSGVTRMPAYDRIVNSEVFRELALRKKSRHDINNMRKSLWRGELPC
jgi:hypothetical protein